MVHQSQSQPAARAGGHGLNHGAAAVAAARPTEGVTVQQATFRGPNEDKALWLASQALRMWPADMQYECRTLPEGGVEICVLNAADGGQLADDGVRSALPARGPAAAGSAAQGRIIDLREADRRLAARPPRRPEGAPADAPAAELVVHVLGEIVRRMGHDWSVRGAARGDVIEVELGVPPVGAESGAPPRCSEALETIATRVLLRAFPETRQRVVVKTEGAKRQRQQQLEALGTRLGNVVSRTGRALKVDGLNPGDRRAVHTALAGRSEVRTRSEGNGPFRRLVIEAG